MKLSLFFLNLLLIFNITFADTAKTNDNTLDFSDGIQDQNVKATEAPDNLGIIDTLCSLILFLQGRTGRVMAAFAMFAFGFGFFLNKISWTALVVLIMGFAFLFGAKSIALIFLPYATTYSDPEDPTIGTKKVTTESIIQKACPELS
jgi:type IV secretory pathway VirB2 component (pilin)